MRHLPRVERRPGMDAGHAHAARRLHDRRHLGRPGDAHHRPVLRRAGALPGARDLRAWVLALVASAGARQIAAGPQRARENYADVVVTSRRPVSGGGSCCGGLRFAPTPLRFLAWGRRRRNSLRACSATFEQRRRVSSQGALRRAPAPSQESQPPQKSPPPDTGWRDSHRSAMLRGLPLVSPAVEHSDLLVRAPPPLDVASAGTWRGRFLCRLGFLAWDRSAL